MATMRLVPSSYAVSNSTSVQVANIDNMYTNIDSTTYGTFTQTTTGTSTYYAYLGGFNVTDIPSDATVNSFTVKIRASATGHTTSTSSSYRMSLYNNTSAISNTTVSTGLSTTLTTFTFPNGSLTWNTIRNTYGANFRIRIPLRRNSRNTADVISVYGAEILVDYTASQVNVTGVTVSPTTASLEVGETVQLTETVAPSNATDKTVSWSTSNSSVATVNNGLVTAVGQGNATITVTTNDGNKTATCTVTVTPAVTYDYKLATTMVVGKKYLIANGNTGSVRLLTNESGGSRQLVGAAATVSSNKISITSAIKSKAEFECVRYTTGNDNTITVKNNNQYLYSDNSSGLRMNVPTTLDRFWHYKNNKFWQFKSTTTDGYDDTSSEYKYYLELNSSNNFTDNHVTTTSIEDSSLPAIYVYVEDDGSGDEEQIYIKQNNSWVQYSKVYQKINGTWVEQDSSTWSTLFNTGTHYRLKEV